MKSFRSFPLLLRPTSGMAPVVKIKMPVVLACVLTFLLVCPRIEAQTKEQVKQQAESQLKQMTPDEVERKLKEMGISREEAIRRASEYGVSLEQ